MTETGIATEIGAASWDRRARVTNPATLPRLSEVTVDLHVLAFAAGAAIATSLVFGLAPALSASGWSSRRGLLASRGIVEGTRGRARRAVVITELALAVMLLTGTGPHSDTGHSKIKVSDF